MYSISSTPRVLSLSAIVDKVAEFGFWSGVNTFPADYHDILHG